MATLALSVAGQFVGGLVGGPIGAMAGRALGALAGSAVDNALFGEKPQRLAGSDLQIQGSVEGGGIPRLYGWNRVAGNIVWATELEEIGGESSGGKGLGGGGDEGPNIAANFAIGLCQGEVQRLGRIWADGKPLETEGLTIRFYNGAETQQVDSLIEAKQGAGNAPAYRGLCYLVFERLPLKQFGNRIPNIAVELCRAVGELEPAIRAVTIIPGATEFGYDPVARVRVVGHGETAHENAHQSAKISDWTLSLDELQALFPNLERVSLVVSWFGDDLRCGQCTIAPRVEGATRTVHGAEWSVAGLTRAAARVVSSHDGGPAYGGTPSDATVKAAIADLKARGIDVVLYPLVMMDIASDNTLPDPYWGYYQPAYPWRGRITCDPAPNNATTPDTTDEVLAQVADFVGTGSDWRYRRMVRHYAQLAMEAGGVAGLIIGSELRGLTTLRDGSDGFPFVDALVDLAAEVRGIVGAGTKLTYAADWSEFSGYQPDGAKYFHLDPLWASADIDAVGIDSYMPTTDWRDGDDHPDAALADSIYDTAYIESRIAGGEGFDFYYASDADRIAANRSPISDGAGEPFVWRFKDIAGWWSNEHHDRPGGVRKAAPTAWVPKSKPIWFTELGCAAVDKGANQPNVFGDPKSSENGRPYFSSGQPDPLMQRQFLRAHFAYWARAGAHNPESDVYAGRMVDPGWITVWTWDARPYPAFPADTDTWSDGPNHATGHWLTGRAGTLATDELVAAIAEDFGIAVAGAVPAQPLIHGLKVSGLTTAREALEPVLAASGLTLRARPNGLDFVATSARGALAVERLAADDGPLLTRKRPDAGEALGRLALTYFDRERGYLTATVTAMRLDGGAGGAEASDMVLDLSGARHAAERMLADRGAAGETVEMLLPPSMLALEPGDAIRVADGAPHVVSEIRDGFARRATARAIAPVEVAAITSDRPQTLVATPAPLALPVVVAAQLPPLPADPRRSRLVLGATARPWPGEVTITDEVTGARLAALTGRAGIGELAEALTPMPFGAWDDTSVLRVTLYAGHLASASEAAVRAGSNRIAVQNDAGAWEIIGFAEAELVAPGTYALTHLLRGLDGSDFAIGASTAGNRVLVLDSRVANVPVETLWLGQTLDLRAFAGRADLTGQALAVAIGTEPLLPLAPVELTAVRDGSGDIAFAWRRRSYTDPNGWGTVVPALDFAPEAYRVTVFDGATAVRTLATATQAVAYAAAEQIADFGASPASFTFTVAQISAEYGAGHAAQGEFHD
jgi:hypothetical protein